jgi:hypothetical protein
MLTQYADGLRAEVDVILALGLTDEDLSGGQLSTLLRYLMPEGGHSKFSSKPKKLEQYKKLKPSLEKPASPPAAAGGRALRSGRGAVAPVVAAPAAAAAAPVVPPAAAVPSPGADWKRVDIGELSQKDLDIHFTMLLQERARRRRGVG